MTLPNFLLIGASKNGTTSLHRYLNDHPEIYMSRTKEPNFFSRPEVYARGIHWYEGLFDEANSRHLAVGEATPAYTSFPEFSGVPERILKHLGRVKLVYVLRHPVERMRSAYYQRLEKGTESRPLDEALLHNELLLIRSCYALQIEQYLAHFPREDLLLVMSDDLRDRRGETLSRIFDFVGVDPTWTSPSQQATHNMTAGNRPLRPAARRLREVRYYRQASAMIPSSVKVALDQRFNVVSRPVNARDNMLPSTRSELEKRLRPDVLRLKAYLGPSFDGWGLI